MLPDLLDGEIEAAYRFANGRGVDLSGASGTTIRAQFLRELLVQEAQPDAIHAAIRGRFADYGLDRKGPLHLPPTGIEIRGARVTGKFDLRGAVGILGQGLPRLIFEGCRFEGDGVTDPGELVMTSIDLTDARLHCLILRNCRLSLLRARNCVITGTVDISGSAPLRDFWTPTGFPTDGIIKGEEQAKAIAAKLREVIASQFLLEKYARDARAFNSEVVTESKEHLQMFARLAEEWRTARTPEAAGGEKPQGSGQEPPWSCDPLDCCAFDFEGAHFYGGITANGVRLRCPVRPGLTQRPDGGYHYALNLAETRIEGTFNCFGASVIEGGIRLRSARISGDLWLLGTCLLGGESHPLSGQGLHVTGPVVCGEEGDIPFRIRGSIWLMAARLSGGLQVSRAHLLAKGEEEAMTLWGIEVEGRVYLHDMVCLGRVNLGDSCISGSVVAREILIAARDLALDMGSASVAAVNIDEVVAISDLPPGQWQTSTVQYADVDDLGRWGSGLGLGRLRAEGGVAIRNSTVLGAVDFSDARIGGSLDLSTLSLAGSPDSQGSLFSLNALNTKVGSTFSITDVFAASEITLWSAAAGLDLRFDTVVVASRLTVVAAAIGRTLYLRSINVLRDVFFSDLRCSQLDDDIGGWLFNDGVGVPRRVDIGGLQYDNFPPSKLLAGMIRKRLAWLHLQFPEQGNHNARTRLLQWAAKANLKLHNAFERSGFLGQWPRLYPLRAGMRSLMSSADGLIRCHLIALLRPATQEHFRPQPYTRLARILTAEGEDEQARQVLAYQKDLERRIYHPVSAVLLICVALAWLAVFAGLWLAHTIWWEAAILAAASTAYLLVACVPYWFYGFAFRYGLSPMRALGTIMVSVLVGYGAVMVAQERQMLVIDTEAVASIAGPGPAARMSNSSPLQPAMPVGQGAESAAALPCGDAIDPFLYAVDVFVPIVDLRQKSKCEIGATEHARPFLLQGSVLGGRIAVDEVSLWRFGKAAYAFFGWIVTSLSVLTFSGVMRRRLED